MKDIGISCAKNSYGRGFGKPLQCKDTEEQSAALCYPPCPAGSKGVGPVCWGYCPEGTKQCGVLCLGPDEQCMDKIKNMTMDVATTVVAGVTEDIPGAIMGAAGVATSLVYPVCNDFFGKDDKKPTPTPPKPTPTPTPTPPKPTPTPTPTPSKPDVKPTPTPTPPTPTPTPTPSKPEEKKNQDMQDNESDFDSEDELVTNEIEDEIEELVNEINEIEEEVEEINEIIEEAAEINEIVEEAVEINEIIEEASEVLNTVEAEGEPQNNEEVLEHIREMLMLI